MKNLLLAFILLAALPVRACDPSYPKGMHGHKLNVSFTVITHYDAPKEKDPSKVVGSMVSTLLNSLAQGDKADFSFNRVDKDAEANLVFRIHILHDAKQGFFLTHVDVYGMGKSIRLFSVNGVAKDAETDPALGSFVHAVAQIYLMVDKGWSCDDSKAPPEDSKLDQNVGKALNF
jgi:hypothetical protein